jgi:hypothetical protein
VSGSAQRRHSPSPKRSWPSRSAMSDFMNECVREFMSSVLGHEWRSSKNATPYTGFPRARREVRTHQTNPRRRQGCPTRASKRFYCFMFGGEDVHVPRMSTFVTAGDEGYPEPQSDYLTSGGTGARGRW